jgi:flagellar hook-length control protein FliK
MATIASNVFLGAGVVANGAPADDARAGDASSDFMQLVQGMIQGNTSGDQLPANLLQLLLTGDTAGLDGIVDADTTTKDKDASDASDTDGSDEAAAVASGLAALLAGLQAMPQTQTPVAGTSSGDSTDIGSIDASGSQKPEQANQTLQALLATTQNALTDAFGEAKGAGDASSATENATTGAGTPVDPNAATNSSPNGTSVAHLQNTLLAHRAADMAPQAASAEVKTPVGAQGWSDEIGTHLAIMAANGREAASLRLSPEHLGPLEIQISVKDGQANVVFGASNPDTRNALEQSLPRLREMFAAQGLTLGNANVSREAPRDSYKPSSHGSTSRGSSDAPAEIGVKSVTLSRLGLVDTYV